MTSLAWHAVLIAETIHQSQRNGTLNASAMFEVHFLYFGTGIEILTSEE